MNTQFTWYEVFQYAINSAKSSSGTSEFEEYSLSLFDLADYLEIQCYEGDQYKNMPSTSENRTYLTIPVDYSAKGATQAGDSIFKQIASSPTWSFYDGTNIEEYWNAYADITLTESNCNFVYDESQDSYYLTIDEMFVNYLKTLSYSEISIHLDVSVLDFDVYAIDLKNFTFKINDFVITSKYEDFIVYNQAYCNVVPTLEVLA